MTNHDVVKKIIGEIKPIGETNTDSDRFESLKEMCQLVENLLFDIDDLIYKNLDAKEASIKKCVDYARNFMRKTVNEFG